ncbi:hypothetical protein QN061_05970 [Vibrio fluvialis]|uniref:hypothetical protein n=1 Tax=Vibrio fluvialis TaxID=676 RepID=UPI0005708A3C|nr:hypothetical protein [Vibrio fluvialis]WIE04328.1 hypothetical protein QN061_05970 [Vibrio fluvialis]
MPAKSIWCALTKATWFVQSKAQQTKANHTKLNQQRISLDGQDNLKLDFSPTAGKEKPRANWRRGFLLFNDHHITVFD